MSTIQILHMYVNVDDTADDNFYHVLVDNQNFNYLSIAPHLGHIGKSEEAGAPCFLWTSQKAFSSSTRTWHPVRVDYLCLSITKKVLFSVVEATCPSLDLVAEGATVIVKLAQFTLGDRTHQ
ncbi:MAG: hypothetical protein M1838_002860 [Thelocarpon superellum]|nr:MAG: hypothetical protein M1838_002860 [Thelocarpon superellum]